MSVVLRPNTDTVELPQGDDLVPIVEKATAVEKAARDTTPRRVGDGPDEDAESPTAIAVDSFNEFMAEAQGRAIKVGLNQLPRKEFRTLLNQHPPRMVQGAEVPELHPDDEAFGFNIETLGDDLVPACMDAFWKFADEVGESDQRIEWRYANQNERDAFLDNLSAGKFSRLFNAALNVNRSGGPDLKARISSPRERTSDETSSSPARLG